MSLAQMHTCEPLLGASLELALHDLKGHSTDFAHQDQFTRHGEYNSACEDSCVMSSMALAQLSDV